MNSRVVISVLLTTLPVVCLAEELDWKWVQQIRPSTSISVQTKHKKTGCRFEKVEGNELFCSVNSRTRTAPIATELVFHRAEIRSVVILTDYDDSKGFLTLLGAAGGGAALESTPQPDWFAGVKVGGPFSLDLQYDMIHRQSAFAIEGAPLLPVFRIPRFKSETDRNFVKLYAEPGIGRRFGAGPFGGYSSAKLLLLFLSDSWPSRPYPYVELQRRFPFNSPMDGDTRVAFGIMFALCAHCGID